MATTTVVPILLRLKDSACTTRTGLRCPGRPGVDRRAVMCFYVFMRTTVELPDDLLREAKARAARAGESLKTLFRRAVAAELGRISGEQGARRDPAGLPVFGNPKGPRVRLSNKDLERFLAEEDASPVRSNSGRGQ